jgi:hypothetical protein
MGTHNFKNIQNYFLKYQNAPYLCTPKTVLKGTRIGKNSSLEIQILEA